MRQANGSKPIDQTEEITQLKAQVTRLQADSTAELLKHREQLAERDRRIAELEERVRVWEWAVAVKDKQLLEFSAALADSSGEWLEKKIADAIAEKFSQERSMVCTYCGHKTVGEGLSAEDFDAKWKQHMLYCEARPEVKLLNALCYIADKYGVPDDSEPEVMKSARDWLARQPADAKREALEAAAERIESIFGVGISGAPEELRQMAQEVPNA